ncbi:flavodoxin domain-containing protein [Planotetraspora sp. A-T 1434]|uniref:flavodoxin domain-containing protein n=1 Tax=Planotetraspora sp. A-T 1434 TaxID=2979219 RepID=UPI0021C24D80|nr:flavodoxin domain-containing protein [Planotetraspora sp. A-T 1434]MCT9931201.1 flavodoxin domain-containing protein [Planotetraspora sp. A-T 1434]
MARVLVAYGSKRGSTAEIAEWIGAALREEGHQVDVLSADAAVDARGYDAVILGGAVYMGSWHRDARRFARRHEKTLQSSSVWMFSSGPLDRSAEEKDIPPVRKAAKWMARLGAIGHMTFGGRLAADARGFPASAMARTMAGDFRNPEQVRAWAKSVAGQLG